ncbi:hypothetical protein JCM8547_006590, partial [Rhodosporidiobolus lusitaniae]
MAPKRRDSDKGKQKEQPAERRIKVKPPNTTKRPLADSSTTLLPFQRNILHQLVPPDNAPPTTNDALLIVARGLGLRTMVTTFLKIYDMPDKLVFVVNATEEEERGFTEEVGMRLKAVGFETAEATREKMYKDGGLFSVTSRILIVDMLKGVIPVHLITGLVVLHAEEVKPTSQEAFVVRIYRQKNKVGFLKAFSDRPESFTFGMSPLQTTLMLLKLRDVLIVPRFHEDVDADLQKRKADVIELYQPLTHDMMDIQNAILECMEATLSEIKRSNHYLEVDDLTVENALFSSFDRVVRTQLDPVWHKVGAKTRGLVYDLTVLRKLQDYLLSYDCVRFNTYLENLLSSYSPNMGSGIGSVGGGDKKDRPAWLGTPAADTIFTVARNRVYLQKKVLPPPSAAEGKGKEREMSVDGFEIPDDLDEADWATGGGAGPTEEEEEMLREMEAAEMAALAAASSSSFSSSANPSTSAAASSSSSAVMPPPPLPAQTNAPPPLKPKPQPMRSKWQPPGVEPVLEEQPKWLLLADVVEEIETQMHWAPFDPHSASRDTILIMCNSSDTCLTLSSYLSSLNSPTHSFPGVQPPPSYAAPSGTRSFLQGKLNSYFYWKAHMGKLQKSLRRTPGFNKGERRSSSSTTSTSTSSSSTAGSFAPNANKGKGGAGGAGGEGEMSAALKRKDWKRGQAPPTKRRRVRGGGAVGSAGGGAPQGGGTGGGWGGGQGMFAAATGANPEALEEDAKKFAESIPSTTDGAVAPTDLDPSNIPDEPFSATDFDEFFGLLSNEDLVIIRPYLGDEDDRVLEEVRPKYVVMYDPNPSFVRRVE